MTNKKFNSFHLKLIAIIAMTINHIGHVFEPYFHPQWWELFYLTIGKITFPIMAFLLIQGLQYTKSFSKYVGRLTLYGLISIIPFHYTIGYETSNNIYILNNIMFTLTIGLIMIKLIELNNRPYSTTKSMDYIYLFIAMLLTYNSDWNIIGILLIWFFYKHPNETSKYIIIISLILTIIEYLATFDIISFNYLGLLLTIPIINQYNGHKGFSNNIIKHGFYIYYPLHLTILWFISSYLIQ